MEQYGVFVDCPKKEMKGLLTEGGKPDIYKTSNMHDAEFEARNCLLLFRDWDMDTTGMSTSVVPLNDDNSFGPPIKKYRLDDREAVEEL